MEIFKISNFLSKKSSEISTNLEISMCVYSHYNEVLVLIDKLNQIYIINNQQMLQTQL